MELECVICGRAKKESEFLAITEYITTDTGISVRIFCICRECLNKLEKESGKERINGGIL